MKKILMFLLVGMFLISFASAFEFDNVKSYNETTKEVTITNALGFGGVIGKAKLNTPLNVKVGTGYQKVAEFDLWAYEDYNDALKQFTFTDMKNKEKINRNYDMKYLSYEDVEVDVWGEECYVIPSNQTRICDAVVIGSTFENQAVWNKITLADLKKNDVLTIGIFTEVQVGDHVDWIPTIYGVEVEEWATWTAELNVGLPYYYKFDDDVATSNVIESIGTINGTASTPSCKTITSRISSTETIVLPSLCDGTTNIYHHMMVYVGLKYI